MPVNCPKCGSDRVQSFQAVFSGGASTIEASTYGVPGGVGLMGRTDTYGQAMTNSAKTCAPPVRVKAWRGGLGLIFGGLIFGSLLQVIHASEAVLGIYLLAVLGAGIAFIVHGVRFNTTKFPGLYAAWQKRWLCSACHNAFEVEG